MALFSFPDFLRRMDFFEAQSQARSKTQWLVLLFILAVLGISTAAYAVLMGGLFFLDGEPDGFSFWNPAYALYTFLGVLAVVGLGSLFEWTNLSAGGEVVANMMGGRRVDPLSASTEERQLVNIVEEMSIASGVAVPAIYVLDAEPSINAFAAGLTTSDAVVAVSRGALDQLSRDELQAVIGHEFSHILNGDMRLNVRLSATIFGILMLAILGRHLLRVMFYSGGSRRNSKENGGGIVIMLGAGLALMLLGYIGYFFGRLIQAAVSRQREYLADASAVQFTRNPRGMVGALNKIRLNAAGSVLQNDRAQEFSHFFFAQAFSSSLVSLFATHPPLEERIRAIDPQFALEAPLPNSSRQRISPPPVSQKSPSSLPVAGFAGATVSRQVSHAQELLHEIPPPLHQAARDPAQAFSLVLALLIDEKPEVRLRQQDHLNADPELARVFAQDGVRLYRQLTALSPLQRLPLFQITLGTLAQFSSAQREQLLAVARQLVDTDGRISIFEYALLRMLQHHLGQLRQPGQRHARSQTGLSEPLGIVLSFFAYAGQSPRLGAKEIFAAGAAVAPAGTEPRLLRAEECHFRRLDEALAQLEHATPSAKQAVLRAAEAAVSADGLLKPEEAELLRAIAFSLDCPTPPLLGE